MEINRLNAYEGKSEINEDGRLSSKFYYHWNGRQNIWSAYMYLLHWYVLGYLLFLLHGINFFPGAYISRCLIQDVDEDGTFV